MAKRSRHDQQVAWVDPPMAIGGIDHLGTLAPCIHVYSLLLPGITNVTERARYYSLYPWLLWSYEATGRLSTADKLIQAFRRADCLLTLIGERHSHHHGEHLPGFHVGLVGRDKLVPALTALEAGTPLRLSDYAILEKSDRRYFKNRFGGLGQYYRGTLFELEFLDSADGGLPGYTKTRGLQIAKAVDAGVPSEAFWRVVDRDSVSLKALDDLAAFCPCQLQSSKREHALLLDLFFDRQHEFGATGDQRRRTLLLLLSLAAQTEQIGDRALDVELVRDAVYTGALPGGAPWNLHSSLARTREGWQTYERNEMLSIAAQSVLAACTALIASTPDRYQGPEPLASMLLEQPALRRLRSRTWSKWVQDVGSRMPELGAFDHVRHERQLKNALLAVSFTSATTSELAESIKAVLQLLASLQARNGGSAELAAYGWLPVTAALLEDYPVNLASLAHCMGQLWPSLTVGQVVKWLVSRWAIETHLRVALRKLRSENVDTFRFYPTEQGYRPRIVHEPAASSPRMRQGLRALEDLGAVELDDGVPRVSRLGRQLLGELKDAAA